MWKIAVSVCGNSGLVFPDLVNFQKNFNVKSSDFLLLVNTVRTKKKKNTAVGYIGLVDIEGVTSGLETEVWNWI